MNNLQVAQGYIDAWNSRDADLLKAAFSEGGTYSDPVTGASLLSDVTTSHPPFLGSKRPRNDDFAVSGNAIGEYAKKSYGKAFPICRSMRQHL